MNYLSQDREARAPPRNTLSYWLPLALTVSAATLGVAAWIWSERRDDDELPRGPSEKRNISEPRDEFHIDDKPESTSGNENEVAVSPPSPLYNQSYLARMSCALRRTPSPQQIFDGASKSIVDGFTAASAAVGTALGSIIEEDNNAYKDHQTWSEEVESRTADLNLVLPSSKTSNFLRNASETPKVHRKSEGNCTKKTVAIVVSADYRDNCALDDKEFQEHASILSYLPQNIDFSKIRLFILIYAPFIKVHPRDASVARSELQVNQMQSEIERSKNSSPSTLTVFDVMYSKALSLVEKESMVLPFTSTTGHVQILRHLGPNIIYLQESLSGIEGEIITNLHTWLRQDIVLIIGDGAALSGLADSETETEPEEPKNYWWKRPEKVGRGRGIIVTEAFRVGDDWAKRVENKE